MTKQTKPQRIGSFILMTIALFFIASVQVSAQKKDYKPGEKIEYKSSGYPEKWDEATFVGTTPGGSQPIIRQKPNEFYPDGFQRTVSWTEIRPLSAKPDNKPPVKVNRKENPADDKKTNNDEEPTETTNYGDGLLTQAEILEFLQMKLGDKPFQNPRREEIKKELAEMIKHRGVDFRYTTSLTDFNSKLGKYGANTSDIGFPLRDNFGEPTKQSWLMGTWKLGKIGAAVDYEKSGSIYRQGEIGVGNVGTLTLNADGTYLWKAGAKDSTSGKWRKATGEEMKSQGGDGIVLLKAKSGYDWIVTKDRNTTLKGEWLFISELQTRQINEYGSRSGKK